MTTSTLSPVTRILHAVIGLGMIALIAVGIYMSETESFGLYGIHKSFGVLLFIFALTRVVWRFYKGWPTPLTNGPTYQLLAAKVTHWVLLLSTLLFPISGMMMSGGSGRGVFMFGIEVIAKNVDPQTGERVALSESAAGLGSQIHEILMFVVITAIVLHVGGALKHQFIDKDGTLNRMFNLGR